MGGVGYSELAAHPEALDQLRQDLRIDGRHDAAQLEQCLTHLGEGATAMLFRCTVCDTCLAYADASLRPLSSAAREIELIIPSEETAPNALSLREKLRVCC
ncbi:CbrC family protein [Streptomyces sp. NPDC016566]|uniref:CbrC family protein n=1 Tax=unclassified Streptomyces TaxID=2593676 RepID=UPI0036F001F4